MTDFEDLSLGKETVYPTTFSRDLLARIPRSESSAESPEGSGAIKLNGFDLWTIYELSWVSAKGEANAAIGELRVPSSSAFIVESKSLKLYINSLYYGRFNNKDEVRDEISLALTNLLEVPVDVHLWPLSDYGATVEPEESYIDLDNLHAEVRDFVDPGHLKVIDRTEHTTRYRTSLFRSLCPVTSQPDWATVFIGLGGIEIDAKGLATYLLGYRNHQAFHESCVEQIYSDLMERLSPNRLTVAARYTRRGGIDINPYRTSEVAVFQMPGRTIRQ